MHRIQDTRDVHGPNVCLACGNHGAAAINASIRLFPLIFSPPVFSQILRMLFESERRIYFCRGIVNHGLQGDVWMVQAKQTFRVNESTVTLFPSKSRKSALNMQLCISFLDQDLDEWCMHTAGEPCKFNEPAPTAILAPKDPQGISH